MQVYVGFELQLTTVHPALKDASRPRLGVGAEEDQKLLVQIPGEEQRVEHLLLPTQTLTLGLPCMGCSARDLSRDAACCDMVP